MDAVLALYDSVLSRSKVAFLCEDGRSVRFNLVQPTYDVSGEEGGWGWRHNAQLLCLANLERELDAFVVKKLLRGGAHGRLRTISDHVALFKRAYLR